MANKFFTLLGHLGLVALEDVPQVVAVAYPPLSGIMGVISSLVLKARATSPTAPGLSLKDQVLTDFSQFEPFIIPLVNQLTGKNLDPVAFQTIVSDANDLAVQWHQLLGTLPTSQATSSTGPSLAPVATASAQPGVVIPLVLQNAPAVKS